MSDKNTSGQENELNPDNDEDNLLFQESAEELEKTHEQVPTTMIRPNGQRTKSTVWSPKQ